LSLTHYAENIGDKPMHLLLVELKDATGGGTSPHR
jgi:oxalate decarboxylase/phosphoglucose isomerase-like protein (cupin superfamily)